jgi:hypothetical protein
VGVTIGTVPARIVLTAVEAGASEHLGALSASRGAVARMPVGAGAPAKSSRLGRGGRNAPHVVARYDGAPRNRRAAVTRRVSDRAFVRTFVACLGGDGLSCILVVRCDLEDLHVPAQSGCPRRSNGRGASDRRATAARHRCLSFEGLAQPACSAPMRSAAVGQASRAHWHSDHAGSPWIRGYSVHAGSAP